MLVYFYGSNSYLNDELFRPVSWIVIIHDLNSLSRGSHCYLLLWIMSQVAKFMTFLCRLYDIVDLFYSLQLTFTCYLDYMARRLCSLPNFYNFFEVLQAS